jgi:hypothetical protein
MIKSTESKNVLKTITLWVGIIYLVVLHGVTLAYFLPSVTINKDYINQQQAELIAKGEALDRCIRSGEVPMDRCKDLWLKNAEKQEVDVNSTMNGWVFSYRIGSSENVEYWDAVGVSIVGTIENPSDFSAPSSD